MSGEGGLRVQSHSAKVWCEEYTKKLTEFSCHPMRSCTLTIFNSGPEENGGCSGHAILHSRTRISVLNRNKSIGAPESVSGLDTLPKKNL